MSFSLVDGALCIIWINNLFKYASTDSAWTLNINSTGAKYIRRIDMNIAPNSSYNKFVEANSKSRVLYPAEQLFFVVYDGTMYYALNALKDYYSDYSD